MLIIKLKYYLGCLLALPLLPIMAIHGKQVRKAVPSLPEPTDTTGARPNGSTPSFNLITIGESTIAGVGVKRHRDGITGSLAQKLAEHTGQAVGWQVYAKSGYTAAAISKKLIPKIQKTNADVIVIGLGGNDAFVLNTPMKWRKQMKTVLDQVRDLYPSAPIVLLNMPPIKNFPAMTKVLQLTLGNLVNLHGEALAHLVKEYDNVYYNSEKISLANWSKKYGIENDTSKYFSDGVHPSQLTYALWAKDIMELMKRERIV